MKTNTTNTTSKRMREYFVSDNSIPIKITADPYFQYYLKLFNSHFNSIERYEMLVKTISDLGGEEEFFTHIREFRENMMSFVKTHPQYKNFVWTNDIRLPEVVHPISKGNVYIENNIGQPFISIDLVEANFQSLKYMCPELFKGLKTYRDMAKQFTDFDYIIGCKRVRQVIFGHLCPSRQQHVQRYIISVIKRHLFENGVANDDFVSASSDEIVFRANLSKNDIRNLVGNQKESIDECNIIDIEGIRLRTTAFTLIQEGTDQYQFFVKEYDSGKKEIKMVEASYMPEVIKVFERKSIQPSLDRMFIKDGRLCQYKDPLF